MGRQAQHGDDGWRSFREGTRVGWRNPRSRWLDSGIGHLQGQESSDESASQASGAMTPGNRRAGAPSRPTGIQSQASYTLVTPHDMHLDRRQ